MSSSQELVAIWFAASIALAVIENAVFVVWLRRKGAPLAWGWASVPGYADRAYMTLCQRTGRSPGRVLWLRRLLLLNLFVSFFFAFPLFASGR
jgi:hypothetical protein